MQLETQIQHHENTNYYTLWIKVGDQLIEARVERSQLRNHIQIIDNAI